jgi:hypothetical protein
MYNVNTSINNCEGCVFVEKVGGIQISCQFDRIEKLRNLGVPIHRSANGHFNFPRKCNLDRPEEWLAKVTGDPKEAVRREVYFSVDAAVDYQGDFDGLTKTLESIGDKPLLTIITTHNMADKDLLEFGKLLREIVKTPYKVINLFDNMLNSDPWDNAFERSDAKNILFIKSGEVVPDGLLDKLDSLLNEEMEQFILIRGKSYTVVNTSIYEALSGNKPHPMLDMPDGIINRIEFTAKAEGYERMIKDFTNE